MWQLGIVLKILKMGFHQKSQNLHDGICGYPYISKECIGDLDLTLVQGVFWCHF